MGIRFCPPLPCFGRRRQHVWYGENQSSTACHPSACLAERTRTSTQPAPAMVMIAASVAIAVVSDPVEARPLFVTPAACFLACSASASWLPHPSWLGRPSAGPPAASWLPPRPASWLRLRPASRRQAPCRTPACRRAWIIVGLGFLVRLVGRILGLVRLVELRLGVGQLRVRLLEVLLGVLQTLDGVPGVVELAGGRVEVVLRLRVCGLGVGDGLVGGLDLLVGGFNLRVGNGLGFERGLLGFSASALAALASARSAKAFVLSVLACLIAASASVLFLAAVWASLSAASIFACAASTAVFALSTAVWAAVWAA